MKKKNSLTSQIKSNETSLTHIQDNILEELAKYREEGKNYEEKLRILL